MPFLSRIGKLADQFYLRKFDYFCTTSIFRYKSTIVSSKDENFAEIKSKCGTEKKKDIKFSGDANELIVGQEDNDDEIEMFTKGPSKGHLEWGGPTKGGKFPEPTRYGDWERKGRATDF